MLAALRHAWHAYRPCCRAGWLQAVLVGPSLATDTKNKHLLDVAALDSRQGPLLGSPAERLLAARAPGQQEQQQEQQQQEPDKQLEKSSMLMRAKSMASRHDSSTWRLLLRHGSINDLNDERCGGLLLAPGAGHVQAMGPPAHPNL
jgi:hypothetical protein